MKYILIVLVAIISLNSCSKKRSKVIILPEQKEVSDSLLLKKYDSDKYAQILSENIDISLKGVQEEYKHDYIPDLDLDLDSIKYFDRINSFFKFSSEEKKKLAKNGLLVTEKYRYLSFWDGYNDIFHKELPVFIPADCILFPLHLSYNKILGDIESLIHDEFTTIIENVLIELKSVKKGCTQNAAAMESTNDAILYFQVAKKLFNGETTSNDLSVNDCLDLVYYYNDRNCDFFGYSNKKIPFSLFKPRGRYADMENPKLENYFRTVMWLSNIKFNFDNERQTATAFIIANALKNSGQTERFNAIDSIIQYFSGKSDNVLVQDLLDISQNNHFS